MDPHMFDGVGTFLLIAAGFVLAVGVGGGFLIARLIG